MRLWLSRLDYTLCVLLLLFLLSVVIGSGMANVQTDAIDYYAIVQRLIGDDHPIVPNLPFVEQRSPGYPLLTLPAYLAVRLTTFWTTPEIVHLAPPVQSSHGLQASEQALLPQQPLRIRNMFFKYFDLAPQGTWFKWEIIAAMLFTGFGLFFTGLIISGRTLSRLHYQPAGYSLPPLIVITSMVFMHNLINTPTYATLTVFGVSCLFTYFWVEGWQTGSMRSQCASGLFAGFMVLTRLETVLVAIVLLVALILQRKLRFARNFVLGGLVPLVLLLVYNTTQFGNPFHMGIFKGNMSQIVLEISYVRDVLFAPQSGILFYSTLASLGIIGLFLTQTKSLKALGWASLALITLIAVRVPVMNYCIGEGIQSIDGLYITCPPDDSSMLELIRYDANRYIIPLVPFAVIGLRELIDKVAGAFTTTKQQHEQTIF